MTERPSMSVTRAVALWLVAIGATLAAVWASAAFKAVGRGLSQSDAWERAGRDPLALALAQGLGVVAAVLVAHSFPRAAWQGAVAELGMVPRRAAVLVLALVAGACLQFPLTELGNVLQHVFPLSLAEQLDRQRLVSPEGLGPAIATLLALVVIAPLSEEVMFRGLLLPRLGERYGTRFALGLTSLLFGASHMNPLAFVYATVAGVILGMVALRAGSTWVSFALHAGVNAVPVVLPTRVLAIEGFNVASEHVYHLPVPLLLVSSLVGAVAIAALVHVADSEHEHHG